MLWVATKLIRAGLFCQGYHWVDQTGAPAPRASAPVVVSNHVSYAETFYLTSLNRPCGMAEKELGQIPCVGAMLRALEFVMLDKTSAERRASAASLVERLEIGRAAREAVPDDGGGRQRGPL